MEREARFTCSAVVTRDRTLLTAAATISPALVNELASSSSSELEMLLVLVLRGSSLLESSLGGIKG